jgi:UPF0271 protein
VRAAVDLNADVGEASDPDGIAIERALLSFVTSVHVACGGHAGDAQSMRDTVSAALASGVRVGAHPSYPDREGFGRRPMPMAATELESALHSQLSALASACSEVGAQLVSVKPHGALYHEVATAGQALDALRNAMASSGLGSDALVLPAGAPALEVCRSRGQRVLVEGFCDRAYAADGTLVDRRVEGAVLHEPALVGAQAVRLVASGAVDTLCIHGDSPGAPELAHAVREALEGAAIKVVYPQR